MAEEIKQINFEEEILMQVRKIMRAIELHSAKLASRFKLTTPQLIVLKRLAKFGYMKPGKLAREINLSHTTVTGILKRLEVKNLVSRQKDTSDGRSYYLSITDAGKAMLDSMPPMLQESFVSRLSALEDWEKTLILSSLQHITSMMSAEKIDAAPVLLTGPVSATADDYASAEAIESHTESHIETATEEGHEHH
jgi:DNA-binding MarR family transcriptional regulator